MISLFHRFIHYHDYKSYDFVQHGYTLSWSGNIVKNFVHVEKCRCGKIIYKNGFIVPIPKSILSIEDVKKSFNGDKVPFTYTDNGGNPYMDYNSVSKPT